MLTENGMSGLVCLRIEMDLILMMIDIRYTAVVLCGHSVSGISISRLVPQAKDSSAFTEIQEHGRHASQVPVRKQYLPLLFSRSS